MWLQMMRKCGGSLHPGRQDEVAPAHRHGLGAGKPRIGRPGGDRDGDDRVLDAGPERSREGKSHDEARKSEEDIGDAHQHRVEHAAEIACDACR